MNEVIGLFCSIPAILAQAVGREGMILSNCRVVAEGTAVGVAIAVINRDKASLERMLWYGVLDDGWLALRLRRMHGVVFK